jgi:asparagine synthase (glutamine-hydrolysing)
MTALVGVFGTGAADMGSTTVESSRFLTTMLTSMRNRGTAIPEQFAASGAVMATRRHDWEADAFGWVGPTLTVSDDWIIAADASLYYVGDLRRRLGAGAAYPHATSGELVLAALRAWGDQFARYIEGDFAIVAWHRPSGRVLLARDFIGKRSLTYSIASDRSLVVASSPRAVIAHPGVSRSLDPDFVAAAISGLHGHGYGTVFKNVSVVPGGATLAFDAGALTLVDRWLPPPFSSDWEEKPSDAAADELRSLIEAAVLERLPGKGAAAVWMSGGWDSTSVFAAGRAGLERRRESAERLRLISLRYPEGDTGDESALVQSIARRWNTDVHWLPVDQIRLFEDADRRASVRDDPRVHPFESQIRSLCQVSRSLDVRVALDGAGGDHVFTVSTAAILADHVRAGRIGLLWNDWRGWGRWHPWIFARSVILPQFSGSTLNWIGSVRGRPLHGFWDSAVPPWVRVTPGLYHESKAMETRHPDEGVSAWETRDVLTTPLVARAMSWNHAIALEEGIHLRSPLFDRRVIEFAASRPLNERLGGSDSKVLLRRAMRDLLPSEVLEPRGRKTGTPVDYFRRQMSAGVRPEFDRYFSGGSSRLASLGVIDEEALKTAILEYQKTGTHAAGAVLQLTLVPQGMPVMVLNLQVTGRHP